MDNRILFHKAFPCMIDVALAVGGGVESQDALGDCHQHGTWVRMPSCVATSRNRSLSGHDVHIPFGLDHHFGFAVVFDGQLVERSSWPDGTVAARYRFLHALYQDVLYSRPTARQQQRVHQQIGEHEEAVYGERAREITAELAIHFEQGRDFNRAGQYLAHAGKNALRHSAHQEAITLLTRGLELLQLLPDTPARIQQELRLQLALAAPLIVIKGYTALEVERTHTRALELCRQLEETP